MFKKMMLCVCVFMSTITFGQIGLNLNIKVLGDHGTYQIKQTIIVNENVPMVLEDDNFIAHVIANVRDAEVIVETKLFEKNDEGELVLLSSPVLLVAFGKHGYVKLGNKVDDKDISFVIVEISPFDVSADSI